MFYADNTYHYTFKEEINYHSISVQLKQRDVNISPPSLLFDIFL